jgi:hypothetical protein
VKPSRAVQQQDIARPDQGRVHRADQQQHAKPAPEARHRSVAAARELQAESDAKQQREDGVELALHQHVLGELDNPVQVVRAEGGRRAPAG